MSKKKVMTSADFEAVLKSKIDHALVVVSDITPQLRMKLHELRPHFITSQIKLWEAWGCESMTDFSTKATSLIIEVVEQLHVDIFNCKDKTDYGLLIQGKGLGLFGVEFTLEESVAAHTYGTYLMLPFAHALNNHIARLT